MGAHRRALDRAASWGLPAHVTVVYPFLPPQRVDDGALRRLAQAVATVAVFDCTFARTAWFADDAVWLAPEPDAPFRALTRAVWDAFPECPPYGGEHGEPTPHLTLGECSRGPLTALQAAEAAVQSSLPVRARIAEALLLAGAHEPDSWGIVARLPLASPERAARDAGLDHAASHD